MFSGIGLCACKLRLNTRFGFVYLKCSLVLSHSIDTISYNTIVLLYRNYIVSICLYSVRYMHVGTLGITARWYVNSGRVREREHHKDRHPVVSRVVPPPPAPVHQKHIDGGCSLAFYETICYIAFTIMTILRTQNCDCVWFHVMGSTEVLNCLQQCRLFCRASLF